MKIIFHSNQISFRGTEIALYDYADYCEQLLGHQAVILTQQHGNHNPLAIEKFTRRFGTIHHCADSESISKFCERNSADLFYAIKAGENDGVISNSCNSAMHAVFKINQPHGNTYAYVSEWLSQTMTGGTAPFVPHMVNLPKDDRHLREALNIPETATVIGGFGPNSSFDIKYVIPAIRKALKRSKQIYFIFMGLEPFKPGLFNSDANERLRFLPVQTDLNYKTQFINTCDAMIHARKRGETFGLAVAEFSSRNKPVITCAHVDEQAHLSMLQNKCILYHSQEHLLDILLHFKPMPHEDWDAYSHRYNPQSVMSQFNQVFIKQKS
jgi:glycosyltransferase involved in cell wall biosynthesis